MTGDHLPGTPTEVADASGPWRRIVHRLREEGETEDDPDTRVSGTHETPQNLYGSLGRDDRLLALWRDGTKPDGEETNDRSALDASLACALAARGFEDHEIEGAIRNFPHGQLGQGALTGDDADRQVARLLALSDEYRDENAPTLEPLFDPEAGAVERWRETTPPSRTWLLWDPDYDQQGAGFLEQGLFALLAGPGGGGKGRFLLQLGASIAAGLPFLGLETPNPGVVFYLSAEDTEAELQRRYHATLEGARRQAEAVGQELNEDALHHNLRVEDRVCDDNLLTWRPPGGQARPTENVDRLIETLRPVENLRLVILDPLSVWNGAGETNEAAEVFGSALNRVARELDATVLLSHHVSQVGLKGGGVEIVRGGTAFVNKPRWVATLQRLKAEKAPEVGVPVVEAPRYLHLAVEKVNNTPPLPGRWAQITKSGSIQKADLDGGPTSEGEGREERYQRVVTKLCELLSQAEANGEQITQTEAERRWAGQDGACGVGRDAFRAIIGRAVDQEGDLVTVPRTQQGGGKWLRPSVNDEF